MKKKRLLLAPALAGLFAVTTSHASGFADAVVAYSQGTGFTPGYTDPAAALGAPSAETVDPHPVWGGTYPVDPFNPPYLSSQVVSIGEEGSLTVQFLTPILRNPANAFGLDFIIFGNTGFLITNGDFSGGGVTDGSTFGENPGTARILVSEDNVTYYSLNPVLAPPVDGLFPTDGAGNVHLPVNPGLSNGDFAGKELSGIRALYSGSAGGTGYSLAWAQDDGGQSVNLINARFVRVEVLSGRVEIDGFAVVPEPAAWALGLLGAAGLCLRRLRQKLS